MLFRSRRPHGLTPIEVTGTLAHHTDTLAYYMDTLANPTRGTHKGSDNDVTDTSHTPPRAVRESVALLRACLAERSLRETCAAGIPRLQLATDSRQF